MSSKAEVKSRDDEEKMSTPKLRFPEFRNSGAWARKKLGTVLRFQPGYPFPSAGFNEDGVGLRLIRNRDLRSDDKVIFYSGSFDQEFVVNNGDVLVGMDGDFTPCIWSKGRALLNQRVGRILPIEGSNEKFLYYFLHAHLKDIEEATARTTVKHLSHSDVERIHEPFPADDEQQKITDCLMSLDEMIAAQGRKVGALKAHKKGLMQQLFPREGETLPRLRFPEFRNAPAWEERPAGQLFGNRTEEGIEGLSIYSVTMTNGLVKRSLLERSVDDIAEADGNKKALKNDIVYNMMRMWQGSLEGRRLVASELTFRAGRQELLYGLGRLVDVREGPNVQGRRFEPGLVRRLVRP